MDNVKFYYTVKNEAQTSFDGLDVVYSVTDGDIHIVYNEKTLCGATRQKGKIDAGRFAKTTSTRPDGKVCEKCKELYKANDYLDWGRWVNSVKEVTS